VESKVAMLHTLAALEPGASYPVLGALTSERIGGQLGIVCGNHLR